MSEFREIEEKWQRRWEEAKIFEADPDPGRKKFFINQAYPYVNGSPHLGHAYSFLRTDAYARFKRMQGFNVLFPQGFQATGEPIVGVIDRLRNNDKDQMEALRTLGATEEDIRDFIRKGPEYMAKYWMERWTDALKRAGFSIDWRRTFITAIDPRYNRFIQWQYNTLREKGYVVQGTHPVVWCPHDQSPTGDHDRLVGEGESPIEFVMIKFRLDSGEILPCATMRPETVYGATNVWVNLDGEYLRADVDGEEWILSSSAVEKLRDQLHKVEVKKKIKISQFIGKLVQNPVTKSEVPILPADFVDSEFATGVVMSVPSHAPYDWVGLHDLKDNADLRKKFGVDLKTVEKIVPISVISVEGMSDNPAIEIVGKMLISSQAEKEKLDKATNIVYKKEFHQGVLRKNTEYVGMKVSDTKEKLIGDFVEKGHAVSLWETTGEVVCRCKTRCYVKILENQWFLKFSDEKWKKTVREAISRMNFYPEIARTQFMNTVDWLKDKACARKSGLGTKLPWDEDWIVETLSDSVIYMAYYTIAHILDSKKIPAEKLTDEVFNYVFLGKGTAKNASKKSKLDEKLIQKMRGQFEYFYPTDVRMSAKELIPNHLTYHIFHHTAMWDDSVFWPRGIAVNGFVTLRSEKMSKRFGNVTRMSDMVEVYGADLTRLNLVGANENMDDADWRYDGADAASARMKFIRDLVPDIGAAKRTTNQNTESFLLSKLQRIVKQTTEACELVKFRSALQSAFFEATSDIKWYIDRCNGLKNCNGRVLREALSTVIKMLSPFMPHIAEEIWEGLGNRDFVSVSSWPKANKKLIDERSELGEELVRSVLEDVRQIQKISGIVPKKVTVIVSPQWKFDVYRLVLKNRDEDLKKILSLIKTKDEATVKYVQALQKKQNELRDKILERQEQFDILGEAKSFFETQLSAGVVVEDAEKSKIEKARNADPRKPAILIV